ncbi:MAG: DMT family transporter [Lentisphaeria bacterium]|nr:DMT family transporter [Lentisphaeria bacterium]
MTHLLHQTKFLQKCAGTFALVITALIWGLAFSAQRYGVDLIPPDQFLAIRSWIGCAVLIPVALTLDHFSGAGFSFWGIRKSAEDKKNLLCGGLLCGLVLFCASLLQQMGMVYASAGKAGFLTALYIVIVPVLGIFLKRRTSRLLWLAVGIVLGGTWLLCGGMTGAWDPGDFLLLGCALCFALHIVVIDRFVQRVDCVRLSILQFLITAVFSTISVEITGGTWDPVLLQKALTALLFCGIGSSGIAYTLQIVGQKYVHPVAASLIMSLESVFSVVGGWLVLGEILTVRELTGCGLILLAVVLAQLPCADAPAQSGQTTKKEEMV